MIRLNSATEEKRCAPSASVVENYLDVDILDRLDGIMTAKHEHSLCSAELDSYNGSSAIEFKQPIDHGALIGCAERHRADSWIHISLAELGE